VNVTGRQPGGVLEGETQGLVADLVLSLQGTGELAGFERTLTLPATAQTMTAPWAKTPGPQHFQTQLQSLSATLPPGDPDFASLSVLGGEVYGFASPGHTTYRPSGTGLWSVDAWLDAGLRVSFTGRAGGALAGFAGQTDTRARLTAGAVPAVLATPGPGPRSGAPGLHVSAAMPNPTRGPLVVMMHLPRHARVRAAVHDVLGRRVRELEDGERAAGVQSVAWDGRDSMGRRAAPGLYMIRVEADGSRFTRSAIVAH